VSCEKARFGFPVSDAVYTYLAEKSVLFCTLWGGRYQNGNVPPLIPPWDAHQKLHLAGNLCDASQTSASAATRKTRMAVK
jgi:hypothetical protein